MVKGDGVHQRYWKTPNAHQVRAHLRVRATQAFEFQSQDGSGIGSKNLMILTGHLSQENHFADIVQQPCRKTFLRHYLCATLRSGDALCQRCHCHAMVPKDWQVRGDPGITIAVRKDMDR